MFVCLQERGERAGEEAGCDDIQKAMAVTEVAEGTCGRVRWGGCRRRRVCFGTCPFPFPCEMIFLPSDLVITGKETVMPAE